MGHRFVNPSQEVAHWLPKGRVTKDEVEGSEEDVVDTQSWESGNNQHNKLLRMF